MNIAEFFVKLGISPDSKSFKTADRLITSLKGALVGLVAYRGWSFLTSSLNEVTDAASKAVEESAKIGVSAEAIQELGYAAGLSGSSMEGAVGALKKFSRFAQSAKEGSQENRKALKELGIDYKKVADGTMSLDEAMMKVSDKFVNMPNGAEKTALAMKVFGRSGADLIPFLNEGSEGIQKMRDEARELGYVIDEETATSLEEFGDDQDKLKHSLTGLKNEIVKALLPTLSKMVKGMIAWIKANRQILASRLEKILRLLITVLKVLGTTIDYLVTALEWLGKHLGLVTLAVGSLVIALLVLKTASIRAALASAVAWATSMAPIIAWGAAIAAVILIIEDLYHWINGGESVFRDMYLSAKKWVGEKLGQLIEGAKIMIQDFLGIETDDQKKVRLADEALKKNQQVGVYKAAMGGQSEIDFRERKIQELKDRVAYELKSGATTKEDAARRLKYIEGLRVRTDDGTIRGAVLGGLARAKGAAGPQMTNQVNITMGPGANATDVGKEVSKSLDNFWARMMRETEGTGGGGTTP